MLRLARKLWSKIDRRLSTQKRRCLSLFWKDKSNRRTKRICLNEIDEGNEAHPKKKRKMGVRVRMCEQGQGHLKVTIEGRQAKK
jgi:hypothetical protein